MITTAADVHAIPPLTHDEAMHLAAQAYDDFLELVRTLAEADWKRAVPDCPLWDVHQLTAHVVGNAESTAWLREAARQQLKVKLRARRSGENEIDVMTALHVEELSVLTPAQLVERLARVAPKAVATRRRFPAFVRNRTVPFPEPLGRATVGYLTDIIYTRDTWMHRMDVCRALGREPVLTPEHDGRILADVVADWARRHGRPFTLTLTGAAGGTWSSASGGEVIELDAVEFCRIMSGRGAGEGLLRTTVPF